MAFYESVLTFDERPDLPRPNGVWRMGSAEAAEMAKLAETTYRDVNIGLANQFARYADAHGIDVMAVIEACNSQPYSHIHRPGIAVGGHCIPVYPRLYLFNDPAATVVAAAREANAAMPEYAVARLAEAHGDLAGQRVAVLGAAYRGGVKETAFSGVFPVVAALREAGADVAVHDPLYSDEELAAYGWAPYHLGTAVDAAVVQADHAEYRGLGASDLPGVRTVLDGRGVLDPDCVRRGLGRGPGAGGLMKVVSIVGARPQFVKLAPIAEALAAAKADHVIVHTGQHYDANMSDAFFADLRIPEPDVNLEIGSGTHGAQTGAMLAALDPVLADLAPDWVLVYGDTNSTLAGTLSAVKQHMPVAHLEAGLRSFNRRMPEEHNRVLTDHAADLLLAPTATAMGHLADEGLGGRSVLVGDVMADVCLRVAAAVADDPLPAPAEDLTAERYCAATIHRAENTDDPARLRAIIGALQHLPLPVVLMAHPRLRARAAAAGLVMEQGSLRVVDPQPYPAMVNLVAKSRSVLTDSGGLQKEAYLLGVPCTTLRTETEWVETLEGGWNVLRPDLDGLAAAAMRRPTGDRRTPYGQGHAAHIAAEVLASWSPDAAEG